MNKECIIFFVLGAAVGGGLSWFVSHKKYKDRMDEEIASMKKERAKHKPSTDEPEKTHGTVDSSEDEQKKAEDIKLFTKVLDESGYTAYSKAVKDASKDIEANVYSEDDDDSKDEPYVISPDEFSMFSDYDTETLTFYEEDEVLADERDEKIVNVESIVGDALNHFGEYEDDVVYVRNERLKIDIEISRDPTAYSDVIADKSYIRGD